MSPVQGDGVCIRSQVPKPSSYLQFSPSPRAPRARHAAAERARRGRPVWRRRKPWRRRGAVRRRRPWRARRRRRVPRRGPSGGGHRGVDLPARLRGGRGDQAHQREGALLQRAHLPPEQDPDRQGRRDLRPHQRIIFLREDDGRYHRNVVQGRRQVLHRPYEIASSLALPATAKRTISRST